MRSPSLLALVLIVPLTACGGKEADPQANAQDTFRAAMQAVAAADLDALWPLLTQKAREGVERELRHWQRRFADPEEGLFLREQIRRRLGPVGEDRFELAAKGSLRDVFRFMMEADPRPPDPVQTSISVEDDGRRVRILYLAPSGEQTRAAEAEIVRRDSGWYVDSLQL